MSPARRLDGRRVNSQNRSFSPGPGKAAPPAPAAYLLRNRPLAPPWQMPAIGVAVPGWGLPAGRESHLVDHFHCRSALANKRNALPRLGVAGRGVLRLPSLSPRQRYLPAIPVFRAGSQENQVDGRLRIRGIHPADCKQPARPPPAQRYRWNRANIRPVSPAWRPRAGCCVGGRHSLPPSPATNPLESLDPCGTYPRLNRARRPEHAQKKLRNGLPGVPAFRW